jgi:hypothetical protein
MITVSFLGLDSYVVGRFSKDATKKLAVLLRTSVDEILFYAPDSFLYHEGVEQTSWQALIKVDMPTSKAKYAKDVAEFLLDETEDFIIHAQVEIRFFDDANVYKRINREYPLFLTGDQLENEEEENELDEDGNPYPDLYEGNVFAGHEEDLKHGATPGECCEGEDCDCKDGCNCEDEHDENCHHHHEHN